MGKPKNPKLKELLAKPVKNKLKKITPSQAKVLKTKAKTEERTLRKEARINSAIEQQKKVPGYAQTKASKKVTDKFITREQKISLTAPFKTIGEQAKVINRIKSNIQIRQLNKTLLGTKKDTNYKTPTRTVYHMDGSTHPPSNTGSLTDHSLKKVKKAGAEKGWRYRSEGVVLKEPNVKEYAQNVKSYVKQKENYEKTIKQEKAAGRLGTKVRQIIKGFNNPKRK